MESPWCSSSASYKKKSLLLDLEANPKLIATARPLNLLLRVGR